MVGILPLLFVNLLFVLDLFYVSLLEITHFQSPRKIDYWTYSYLFQNTTLKGILVLVDVYVTLECILLCILCIVTRCLFPDVSIMYLSHVVMPRCSDRED